MRTLTITLTIVLLAAMAFLCNRQESDIISLRHWNHMQEREQHKLQSGLRSFYSELSQLKHRVMDLEGGLGSTEGGLDSVGDRVIPVAGGLAPAAGGLSLHDLRARAAMVNVKRRVWKGPISSVKNSGGTGTFVSDNIILTCKHVVEKRIDDQSVTIVTESGEVFVAIQVLEDVDDDLALVLIVGRSGPVMEVGPPPNLGAELILIGAPFAVNDNRQLTIAWARVSREIYGKDFLTDGFAWHGYSGGPAITDGKIVGVLRARRTGTCGLGFAVPIHRLDPGLRARF